MSAEKPRRLGRGLEALFTPNTAGTQAPAEIAERKLPIRDIRPNPLQPRLSFDPAELAELESSLKVHGMLQPVVVRKAPKGPGFELVAGERRFRAATNLGWTAIPAIVRDVDDASLLTLALIENLQRSDLKPLEEAEGYRKLIEDFNLSQQQVATAVGKDRSTIANMLRLLHLPVAVRRLLQEGALTLGHARALLGLPNERAMAELAREVVAKGLTVRDVERRVRRDAPARERKKTGEIDKPAEASRIEEDLRRYLQTDVSLNIDKGGSGSLRLAFYSAEDLDRLLDLVMGATRERR
jgi:ParB family transcriptional regulator, chromosome partitioning protein